MKKTILAWIGRQGAGKEKLTETVLRYCGSDRVSILSTGGIMRKIATTLGMKPDRPTCDKLVQALVEKFGGAVLASAIESAVPEDPNDVIVYDCPRRLEDMEMLDRLRRHNMVIVVFIDRSPEDRFTGLRERARAGEKDLTWENFLVNENLPQERFIGEIIQRANLSLKLGMDYQQNELHRLAFCKQYLYVHANQS